MNVEKCDIDIEKDLMVYSGCEKVNVFPIIAWSFKTEQQYFHAIYALNSIHVLFITNNRPRVFISFSSLPRRPHLTFPAITHA